MSRIKVLVIVGPTASGKSALAVKLAKKFNGEIISADSRQVYKDLNIATSKITKKEMKGVTHHLLDVITPKKQFSVAQYKTLVLNSLQNIVRNHKLPIIAGGTGFYIDAVTGRADFPNVPPNMKLRAKLEKKSVAELFRMLEIEDPCRAQSIDPNNKIRLIRALEIIHNVSVTPLSTLRVYEKDWEFIFIGIKSLKQDERIYNRLQKKIQPMIQEAKKLIKLKVISYRRMYELGLEYRYLALYLKNKLNLNEMADKIYIESRHYAKRQMTWFKRNNKIKWFTLSSIEGFKPEEYMKIERYAKRMIG